MTELSTDPLVHSGEVRTDMNCTNCGKIFIALIDYSIDGPHCIECAFCGHEHLRKITNGKITEERWGSRDHRDDAAKPRKVWKVQTDVLQATTSSASEFIRQRWLEKAFR